MKCEVQLFVAGQVFTETVQNHIQQRINALSGQ